MKAYLIFAALFVIQLSLVVADTAPVSFYDPESRQNRPVWWIKQNPPSLYYSVDRLEQVSNSPLFMSGNAERTAQLQTLIKQQRGQRYSWAEARRLEGLQLIESGAAAEAELGVPATPVLGVAGQRFVWESRRSQEQFKVPIGLVGILAQKFPQLKNELYKRQSTRSQKGVLGVSNEIFNVE